MLYFKQLNKYMHIFKMKGVKLVIAGLYGKVKNDFKKIVESGKNAKQFMEKSKDTFVKKIDQNNDGKFDIKDVSVMAETVKDTVGKNARILKETIDEKVSELELKVLQPIFEDTLCSDKFAFPKFVRITERDKKYTGKDGCKKSIGYWSEQKGIRMINIFRDSVEFFDLSFYPNPEEEFYYADPCECKKYIVLDEYFNYLKQVRVGELQMIAQELGAKHFRVVYKEEKKSVLEKVFHAAGTLKVIDSEVSQDSREKKYNNIEIASEMEFVEHAPQKPELKYLKHDPTINSLIEMRMKEHSVKHQKLVLKLSNSSGLKESEAMKVDAALKMIRLGTNSNILKEAQRESRRSLEYEIDF